ncbi:MAG: DNA alkylation repair protein [Clostridia bacterium]|nr:DNA alkylation repair protein [Clostridia bacterium]
MDIQKELFKLQDEEYKSFHSRLMPTVNPELIIGVRVPLLRKLSKEFAKTAEAQDFLLTLPHRFYEENNVHAFVIEEIKDFDEALAKTEEFLPYIDNWATCDMFMPKVFKKNTDKLLAKIREWICSDKPYTVRYAIGLLMKLYLDEEFNEEFLELAASVKSEEYYVNMMIAWYFATALAKQYDAALPYITDRRLEAWTHNKAIRKAIESNRIDTATKHFLRAYTIK